MSGQSEPIVTDQWVSTVADTRGHDLSVANSVEHDAPDFKHAKYLRVGQLSRRASAALWRFGPYALGSRLVGTGLYTSLELEPMSGWELLAALIINNCNNGNNNNIVTHNIIKDSYYAVEYYVLFLHF